MEKDNYIDAIFDFLGIWDSPSKCGLKILRKGDKNIIVVTEIYNDNPGTSVTQWVAQLSTIVCNEKKLDLNSGFIIEHTLDKGSHYFNSETFYNVKLDIVDGKFINPRWELMTKEAVDQMLS